MCVEQEKKRAAAAAWDWRSVGWPSRRMVERSTWQAHRTRERRLPLTCRFVASFPSTGCLPPERSYGQQHPQTFMGFGAGKHHNRYVHRSTSYYYFDPVRRSIASRLPCFRKKIHTARQTACGFGSPGKPCRVYLCNDAWIARGSSRCVYRLTVHAPGPRYTGRIAPVTNGS